MNSSFFNTSAFSLATGASFSDGMHVFPKLPRNGPHPSFQQRPFYNQTQVAPSSSSTFLYQGPISQTLVPSMMGLPQVGTGGNNGMIMAIPLPPMSPKTQAAMIHSVSQAKIEIPVNVQLSSGILLGNDPSVRVTQPEFRGLGYNPLLSPIRPSIYAPLTYLPTPARTNRKRRGANEDGHRRHKTPVGFNKWFAYRRAAKLDEQKLVNRRLNATKRELKRLQNAYQKRNWKSDKKLFFHDNEETKQSRRKFLERKGYKKPLKEECELYNCPRKEYKRNRPFMPIRTDLKSPSVIDLSPGRSRSPIVIGQQRKAQL